MDPASDSVVLLKESDFGITDPDVDSSARTTASNSHTVATVSDTVILTTASRSVVIFSTSGFVFLITASSFVILAPCLWYLVLIMFSVARYLFSYYRPAFWLSSSIWFWYYRPSFLCPYHGVWFWHYWPILSFRRRHCRTLIWHYCLSSDSVVFTTDLILILLPKIAVILTTPSSFDIIASCL